MKEPHEYPMPEPDPEWKRRFEAKMRDLETAREQRQATPEQRIEEEP